MTEDLERDCKTVNCNCNGVRASGTYSVDGHSLVLTSPFGVTRVAIGLLEPHRLATKVLKNICTKATARTSREAEPRHFGAIAPKSR